MKPQAFLIAFIVFTANLPVVLGAVTSVEITPVAPVQGDTVNILITASPNEEVPVTLSFTKVLAVTNGEYKIDLNGIQVPQTPNSFTVKASGVTDLNVAVKILFWITKSATATDGVATVSQGGVPAGKYEAQIYGNAAAGVTSVTLTVKATTTVTMGSDGTYNLNYDTSAVPPGEFTAKIGVVTKTLTLSPPGGGGGGGGGVGGVNAPVAVASFPSIAYMDEPVEFDGTASYAIYGNVVGWSWDFGDGYAALDPKVTHVYKKTGNYTVTLTVTDTPGMSGVSSWPISIVTRPKLPPVSKPGTGRTILVGGIADFDGGASYDPDGNITVYNWDFGDGSVAEGVNVNHIFKKAGVYRVALTVTDDDGLETTAGLILTVESLPISAEKNATLIVNVGDLQHYVVNDPLLPISVTINTTSPVTLTFIKYSGNPHPDSPLPLNALPIYYDITVSNPDAISWPLLLRINCSALNVGRSSLDRLGLFYYDTTGWQQCQLTGVDSDGMVWALISRLEASGSPILIGEKASGAAFQVSDFKLDPLQAYIGSLVNVSLVISNIGTEAGEATLSLLVDGVPESSLHDTLSPGDSQTIVFSFTRSSAGVFLVEVAGLSKTVTFIFPPKPADIVLVGLDVSPLEVNAGEIVTVSASFTNQGELDGSKMIDIKLDGLTAMSQRVELGEGESTILHASFTLTESGEHVVSVDGESRTIQVHGGSTETPPNENSLLSLLSSIIVITIIGACLFAIYRRRRSAG